MLFDNSFEGLKRGLSYSVRRHELIADNIANVSTPNYRRKDLDFKNMLSHNINDTLPLTVTNEKHMSSASISSEFMERNLYTTYPNETDIKTDNNNVDLDKEVVNMTTNNLYYNSLATIISKKYKNIKDVIAGRTA
ncbi:MAG: flagellar basal body rod protein FlgB [Candidatus Margulisbacteria bacterium]|nr:flagellar basal body rod protein FlgB [Candidatus Margulisiibacteriota bacterium]